ncbi:S-100 EF-hand domain-containing protein [Phanerochaete sordida]|uniref:S-100 EF-hand domain-containing protein n=1 Tax=Phanerochaete sordida TaxID=48140 RepID=A0A9P3FZY6_9APHY|nr:S-100 EF-hand domain-containing protein [Phanerochaete sordida]
MGDEASVLADTPVLEMHSPLRSLVLVISTLCIAISFYSVQALPVAHRRDLGSALNNLIDIYHNYAVEITHHAETFHRLAQEPAVGRSADFKQQCATEVSGFLDSLQGFQSALGQLSTDNGLANNAFASPLETLFDNTVTATKDLLRDINALVDEIPTLGSVLDPMVVQIMVITDDMLDEV